ncbi:DUF1127 domain-containing protein [Phyllobacterium sp. P30BS-XVII]|uniref:DUF1127 domain-containing protein n=2 Tax=Phyllobacterium TaxID=28100 RepID=UPI000DDE73A0|nr:DUF1127 domain-containing protein [Phyllobacterium sp. P30BS-XVII]MBA8899187.1 uncharacterized protein YjiS (DUF1127 family) [Phyllobacterium sp. P30BS-XVII]
MMEADMADIASFFFRLASHWRAARTYRHINELPDHILADIGWPEAYFERRVKHAVMDEMCEPVIRSCDNPVLWRRSPG